jgi:multicomponent Na+:H+ antiporter subunit D
MNAGYWLPILIIAVSFTTGFIIFALKEERHATRAALNMAGATLKLVLVLYALSQVLEGHTFATRIPIGLGFDFVLRIDELSLLFLTLSAGLWFFTTIYAIGYLEGAEHRSRFFGFFSLCVTASAGVALAGNLISFFIFYELLTLVTYPLVVHRQSEAALRAGRTYLWYTMTGGAVLLVGVVWLHVIAGSIDFEHTGGLAHLVPEHSTSLAIVFAILIAGLGVKAALVPLHGWLPVAMVAPAPVSALLHAVAVVKAGAFGIVRVVYDIYGLELADALGVLTPLAALAAVTIIYGSVRALAQDDLKKRLAYSTISQVSYITLGVATLGLTATIGGLVHIVHQGIMKITLFFCAGNFSETLEVHKVSEMDGIGRRMPLTMAAFTIAAIGMIGLPPVAGFVSKWYLALGGIESGHYWVVAVLLASSVLNMAYFLPLLYAGWFKPMPGEWVEHTRARRLEAPFILLLPPLATAVVSLGAGLFAAAGGSPLDIARHIAALMYTQP